MGIAASTASARKKKLLIGKRMHKVDMVSLVVGVVSDAELYEDSLDSTPKSAQERRTYSRYCPICFKYYRATLESTCCGHYCCARCAVEFVSKFADGNRPIDQLRCPSCNVPNLRLAPVDLDSPPRSYEDDLPSDTGKRREDDLPRAVPVY